MVSERRCLGGTAALGLAMVIAVPAWSTAGADTTVKASYVATLAGFPIGSGTLDFGYGAGGDFRATVDAQVRGLATMVANRTASATATGKATGNQINSLAYQLAIEGGPEANLVDMAFAGGAVKQLEATELHFPGWDRRVPLLPEHKKGVIDPLAAFVLPLAAGRDPLDNANCERTARVFDGRVRYDLRMTYGAKMEVMGKEGYSGPALVCAVAYKPIAGFRPLSPAEEKFERNLEMSIWFVPVAGVHVLIPYKVVVGTPIGLLQVYARDFTVKDGRSAEVSSTETTGSVPAAH